MITAIALGRTPVWADSSFTPPKILPNGKTELPTDNIQTWLNCADIWDKDYQTLGQVMADTETLSALMADENAVDYLVRSKTWISTEVLTPVMTDDTHPVGYIASASSYAEGYEPYKAFNNAGNSSAWKADTAGDGQWLQIELPTAEILDTIQFTDEKINNYNIINTLTIYGINDGEPIEIGSMKLNNLHDNVVKHKMYGNNTAYKKYRFEFTMATGYTATIKEIVLRTKTIGGLCDNATAMTYIGLNNYAANTLLDDYDWRVGICMSNYFESVLNVKVPAMTGNTTPSGICTANPHSGPIGYSYLAFDKDLDTRSGMSAAIMLDSSFVIPYWSIGYRFPSSVKCYRYDITPCNTSTNVFMDKYNVDCGSGNAMIGTQIAPVTTGITHAYVFEQNLTKDVWYQLKIYIPKGPQEGAETQHDKMIYISEIQFYGREDV